MVLAPVFVISGSNHSFAFAQTTTSNSGTSPSSGGPTTPGINGTTSGQSGLSTGQTPRTHHSGTVVVTTHLINTNGGTKQASDYDVQVAYSPISGSSSCISGAGYTAIHKPGSESGTSFNIPAPSCFYAAITNLTVGDTITSSPCDYAQQITPGQTMTCNFTITTHPTTGNVVVTTHVINTNGGTKQASDYDVQVAYSPISGSSSCPSAGYTAIHKPGSESGTSFNIPAPSCFYAAITNLTVGDTITSSPCDYAQQIAPGQTMTCTYTIWKP